MIFLLSATNYSVTPTLWEHFLEILNDDATITKANRLHLPIGARVAGAPPLPPKTNFLKMFRSKSMFGSVFEIPTQTNESFQRNPKAPFFGLFIRCYRSSPLSRSTAFALSTSKQPPMHLQQVILSESVVGLQSQQAFFVSVKNATDPISLNTSQSKRAPKVHYIVGREAMAQLCIILILIVHQTCEPRPGVVHIQSGPDNTGAETNINHGFLTTVVLSDIIKLVSMVQLRSNTFLNVHHIPGEKSTDADGPNRKTFVSVSIPFLVQRPSHCTLTAQTFGMSLFISLQKEFFLIVGRSLISILHCCYFPQAYPSRTMRPITIVKRFLKGETPSIPLPPGIADDMTSNPSTGSWLLVSQNGTQANHTKNTKEVECQTSPNGPPLYHCPRACAKRFFGLSNDAPASVPSFPPKSRLPKLHHGGLQAPQLHCFATSSCSDPYPRTPQPVPYVKPIPKSLPSPASFRKAIATLQFTMEKDASEAERARSQLRAIFYEIQFSYKLFCEIRNSEFLDQHIDRVADSLGTGGFLAYIGIWNHWACW